MKTTNLTEKIQLYFATIYALFITQINNTITQYIPLPTQRSGVADMKIVVYIIIIFLIAAILFPIAMTQVTAATTTSWGSGVGPVYAQLLPILVIVGVALHIFGFV